MRHAGVQDVGLSCRLIRREFRFTRVILLQPVPPAPDALSRQRVTRIPKQNPSLHKSTNGDKSRAQTREPTDRTHKNRTKQTNQEKHLPHIISLMLRLSACKAAQAAIRPSRMCMRHIIENIATVATGGPARPTYWAWPYFDHKPNPCAWRRGTAYGGSAPGPPGCGQVTKWGQWRGESARRESLVL